MSWSKKSTEKLKGNEEPLKNKKNILRDILSGDFFAREVLNRHFGLFILLFFLGVIYINNRYSCEKEKNKENMLRKELKDLRYESLTVASELMSISRRSNVLKMVKERNLGLEEATEAPIRIVK